MKKQASAFTLIELLVVIAIIAILAAILFPVFAQAKAAAKKTNCLSNMKNVGLGVLLYMGDYEDTYPLAQRDPTTDEQNGTTYTPVTWQYTVNPYVKNGNKTATTNTGKLEIVGGVWNCPSFPVQGEPRQYGVNMHLAGDYSIYGYNDFGALYGSIAETQVSAPAQKVLIGEKGYMGSDATEKDWSDVKLMTLEWAWNSPTGGFDLSLPKRADRDDDAMTNPWPWAAIMPRFRHNEFSNMNFADGHAKSVKLGMFGGASGWCKYFYNTGTVSAQWGNWYPQTSVDGGITAQGPSACDKYQ